jgi:hypothetical protein
VEALDSKGNGNVSGGLVSGLAVGGLAHRHVCSAITNLDNSETCECFYREHRRCVPTSWQFPLLGNSHFSAVSTSWEFDLSFQLKKSLSERLSMLLHSFNACLDWCLVEKLTSAIMPEKLFPIWKW